MRHLLTILCLVFCASMMYAQQLDRPIKKERQKHKHKHAHNHAHDHQHNHAHNHQHNETERTSEGFIRCYHTQMEAQLKDKFPERSSREEFEKWITPKIEEWKAKNANKSSLPILTIPVVFHIITDGAGAENLSAAIVQAQLDQLNIDFRNLAGSTDPVAADVEIEFCLAQLDPSDNVMAEPGINRVTAYGDGPFSTNQIENNIKANTIWNPSDYMNIWTADIQGGILGYAQFPSSSTLSGLPANGGSANTDGVVVGYGTVGSVAVPGSAPPYNLGRTLTHEVGHWVGLIHIWGDGGCGIDDFCADTPESDASNGGCPNHTSCGSVDMVENYMDYTNDACMDIFTADQKARIRTVMANSPRRVSLPLSTKCTVADYSIAAQDSTIEVCPPANAVYTINIGEFGGYSTAVSLSVSGLPAGATANFGSTSVTPVGSTILTISGIAAVTPGSYNITVNANSTSGAQTLPLVLVVSDPAPTAAVNLTSPANGASGVSVPTTFNWNASPTAGALYDIDIATDPGFSNIVDNATALSNNSYSSTALSSSTTYYWRVSVSNACGAGPTSSTFSFSTSNCAVYTSTNIPVALSATGTPTVTSTLNIPATGTITDVNVTTLQGTHTYISDLTISLSNPSGTSVDLISNICANEDDFDVTFDDGATNPYASLPCPPVGGGNYQPSQVLSAFNGQLANGTWTLTVADAFDADGGSLDAWAIEVCVQPQVNVDAGISSIINPPNAVICDNPFTPEVVLLNAGTTTLTSATINYQIDAGAVQTFNWTGSLAAGNTANVVLNPISSPTTGAAITFRAYTSNPNAGVDGNTTNDTSSVVTEIETTLPIPYAEGFNAGAIPANITILNPDADAGEWEHTTTANAGAGTGSMVIDNNTNNTSGTLDWFVLPTLDFSGQSNVIMTFDVAYARYDGTYTDTLIVAVNDDCGTQYTPEYFKGGTELSTAADQTAVFVPTAAQWRNDTLDLSAYDGMGAVKIGFINLGGWGNTMYIDNINIVSTVSCAATASITSSTNVSCNAGNDGSATALGANGTAPYSYAWSSGATTATANNLAAGTYTVTVTDAAACAVTETVVITAPTALTASTSSTTNVDCNGGSNGAATIVAAGGTAGYQYNIGSGNQASGSFSGLSAGNYTVTITDANGCTITEAVNITQPSALGASISAQTNVACNGGNTGAVTVAATGGTTGYQYNIGSGNQASGTFSNLSAGSYTVTITDANGCTTTQAVNITQPASALSSSTSSSTNVSCNGDNNGSFVVTASGGTSPYQYNIGSGNQGSGTFSNLSAGNYTVNITDANGCTTTEAVSITEPTAIAATTSSTGESCTGNDGAASVSASGGTGSLSYAWSTAATGSSISGLAAGSYTVTITDANGCTAVRSVVVANSCNPCSVASSVSSSDANCNAACDGTIAITPTGGTAPYSYTWGDGATTGSRSNLCVGTYTVTIVDNAGCTGSQSVTINEPTALTSSASSSSSTCVVNSGTATATAVGGTAPYTYLWNTGATSASISNLAGNATYDVTITDANGCQSTASTSIATIPTGPTVSASGTDLLCNGDASGDATASVSGGTAPFSYSWNNGATTQSISNLDAGNYDVTITDANGCSNHASVNLTEPLVIAATAVGTNPTTANNNGSIDLTVSGGTAPYTYNWSNGSTNEDPSALAAGTYAVTVTDANGCETTASVTLTLPSAIDEPELVESFAIMPNPNTGQFVVQIELAEAKDARVELVDVLGRSLREWNFAAEQQITIPVDISNQAGGMYLLILRTNDGNMQTRKVTVGK